MSRVLLALCPICGKTPGGPFKTAADSYAITCIGPGHSICMYGPTSDDAVNRWDNAFAQQEAKVGAK